MSIRVLDSETIDKIAAGEVVEKPASIVKELVENALDAGATAITVEAKEGGISFIRVTDNGCGIEPQDLSVAFLRHATSKIGSADDLNALETLGFRGEALSSICAVTQTEMITKTADSLTGIRICVEGGVETDRQEIGAPQGTTVIVRNLFFNTPVRRKFLKTAVGEAGAINELMERLAISRPDVAFQYTINGKDRFHTSGSGNLKDTIYRIYGREIAGGIVPVSFEEDGLVMEGFIGKPELVRSSRDFELYFINGRYVKSSVIANAIEEGYREYLMLHRFPLCVLNFRVDPARVDVNVHPTKMEVRISDQKIFTDFVEKGIHEVLVRKEMIPGHVLETPKELKELEKQGIAEAKAGRNPEPFESSRRQEELPVTHTVSSLVDKIKQEETDDIFFEDFDDAESVDRKKEIPEPFVGLTKIDAEVIAKEHSEAPTEEHVCALQEASEQPQIVVGEQLDFFEERILSKDNRAKYRIIGQIFDTYWIVQFERKLFIIDQHAAHEKVNYERIMKRFHEKQVVSQNLLPPIIVSLSGREELVLNENIEAFRNLGYEIEPFGGNEYALRGVPADLYGHSERELFLAVLDELSEGNSRGSYRAVEEKIASMSCKAAIKGGDTISTVEAEHLIDELLTLENPYNCPHGRPTIIAMTEKELEVKFKRIVQ